jgi:site-specific DNA-cytosine methylase
VRLGDVLSLSKRFMKRFDVIWASPPCQLHSDARTQGAAKGPYAGDLLQWSLDLPVRFPKGVVWVENVTKQRRRDNRWGKVYNAHQFGVDQNRNRVIGGRYPEPKVERPYKRAYDGICPCITATEYKGCASDTRRASRFYKRRLTMFECATHMGLDHAVVQDWYDNPMNADTFRDITGKARTEGRWRHAIYRAIGNGVPIHMAKAFGDAAARSFTPKQVAIPFVAKQLHLFA